MFHPRNIHHQRYDFGQLIESHPPLKAYVADNGYGELSINFFDPLAVKCLNQALLYHHYNIEWWDIPPQALTPPIPGRADYIHHLNDLLNPKSGQKIKVLDIGIGANCIYPIVGVTQYGWDFVGSDIDLKSIENSKKIIDSNQVLRSKVELRHQKSRNNIFEGMILKGDFFDATVCNPPFHDSSKSASQAAQRKLRNLKGGATKGDLNFGGRSNELWCEGGELRFVSDMIRESAMYKDQCRWFTTLVSKESNLPQLKRELKKVKAIQVRTINMHHGNKQSRIIAWQFSK